MPVFRHLPASTVATWMVLLLVPGCSGEGGGGGGTGTETGSGSGASGASAGSGTASSGGAATDASAGSATGTSGTTSGAGSTAGSGSTSGAGTAGACSSVVLTYDLTGTVMRIDALQDFEITVQEPYDDDLNMGPATMKIRFTDDGNGMPGQGPAQIVEYRIVQNFVTGSPGLATVTTDIVGTSGPDGCGTATGVFGNNLLTWHAPAQMDPYCRDGTVSCMGAFCGQAGSPPENQPFVFDNDCSEPHPLEVFTFTNALNEFSSPPVTISMDNNQTVTLEFHGTAVASEVDTQTPACACP